MPAAAAANAGMAAQPGPVLIGPGPERAKVKGEGGVSGKAAKTSGLKQAVGTVSVPGTGRLNEVVLFLLSLNEAKNEPVMVQCSVGANVRAKRALPSSPSLESFKSTF